MKSCLIYFLSLLIFLVGATAQALTIKEDKPVSIWPEAQLLVDTEKAFHFFHFIELGDNKHAAADVHTTTSSNIAHPQFEPVSGIPNLGLQDASVWVRLPLTNTRSDTRFVLEAAYPHLSRLDVHIYRYDHKRWQSFDLIDQPLKAIQDTHRFPALQFDLAQGETALLVMRVQTDYPIRLPVTVGPLVSTKQTQLERDSLVLLSLGILLALMLYNLFIFSSTRQVKYLYYCLNLLFLLVFFFLDLGLVDYWWPQSHWLNDVRIWALTVCVAFIFAILFAQSFLQLPKYYPKWNRWFMGLSVLVGGVVALTLAGHMMAALGLYLVLTLLYQVSVVAASIYVVRKGFKPAMLFLFAWVFLAIGGAVYEATLLGAVPVNAFTGNAFLIGTVVEALFLSWALASYINQMQREQIQTERRFHEIVTKTNRKLSDALEDSEKLRRVRDVFLTNITHELKTPLLSIAHVLDLLREGLKPERQLIMDANHSSRLIARHIDKLLLNTEMSVGEPTFSRETAPLGPLLQEWQQDLKKEADAYEKYLQFATNLDQWDEMNASVRALHLILNELVFFSLPISEKTLKLDLEYQPAPQRLKIRLDYVQLAAAQRIHSALQEGHMLGAGGQLGFVKSIIQLLHGDFDQHIDQTSDDSAEQNRPAYIEVMIPLVKCTARPASEALPKRVLVVEDNKINQTVLASMLQRMGVAHDIANNGEEALQMQAVDPVDLILMDCQMPVLNGYDATETIRADVARYGRPRIIAVSANSMEDDKARCLAVGMDDFVAKPVRMDQLREVLLRWTAVPSE